MSICPCGTGRDLAACCGPLLAGAPAPTAEALMRSRYTAYVVGNLDHIEATNAPDSPGSFDRAGAQMMVDDVAWSGLEDDTLGQDLVHHEASNFVRVGGRWAYFDGEMSPKKAPRRVLQVGRNDPCPCGSGKKFKKCCGI
jgi:SEC-C motif-containing protein